MPYQFFNINPDKNKIGDCVIRAVAKATGKEWEEVYKDLCAIGLEQHRMPNDKEVYTAYLTKMGWKKMPMPRNGRKRMTIKQFSQEQKGVYIISIARHLTVIDNGTLYDIWNCENRCMGNYWEK